MFLAPHNWFPLGYRRRTAASVACWPATWRVCAFGLLLATAILIPRTAPAQDEEEYVPDLPGLVCTITDGTRTVTLLEPRLAFTLAAGESPHPQIAAETFQSRWRGRLNVLRPGTYRFAVELTGRFRLSVAGTTLLDVRDDGSQSARRHESEPVELDFGEQPLEAEFERIAGQPAHLRVFWQREGDFWETLVPVALGHPKAYREAALEQWEQIETGRRLVADLRCTRCHQATEQQVAALGLPVDGAADLANLGDRVEPAWLYHWLANPHALRPKTVMPALFGTSLDDQTDLYAAVEYLTGGRLSSSEPSSLPKSSSATDPPRAFAAIGCIACHAAPGESVDAESTLRPLTGVGSKCNPQSLRQRIVHPQGHHPDSRMPNFGLAEKDETVDQLVAYLASSRNPKWEERPQAPPVAAAHGRYQTLTGKRIASGTSDSDAWKRLGKVVVQQRGCFNCHTLGDSHPAIKQAPSLTSLLTPTDGLAKGCLADTPAAECADYRLSEPNRNAIHSYLTEAASHGGTPAPLFMASVELDRLRCTSCHARNGSEGTFAERILSFVELGTDQTLRDLAPPELTGIGEKLRPEAIRNVIISDTRARPWMELRMPTYDRRQVESLPQALVHADGCRVGEAGQDAALPPAFANTGLDPGALIEAGRLLVGRTGMNCVSCHDLKGIPSGGTRGPDLAYVTRRVTPEWFQRWMLDPQRIIPGTRMPTVFFGGKSAAPQYLNGDPDAQLAAIWTYLSLGPSLPLPVMPVARDALVEGGENPKLPVGDRPVLARGFMHGVAGLRGIALGTPAGLHFAFDSAECRLAAAWPGEFVEVHGWFDNGRGTVRENGTEPLAEPTWRGPKQPIVHIEGSDTPPRVQFTACWAMPNDAGFAWRVETSPGKWVEVEERLTPDGQNAFVRELRLKGASDKKLLLALAEVPLLTDAKDSAFSLVTDQTKDLVIQVGSTVTTLRSSTDRTFTFPTIERTIPAPPPAKGQKQLPPQIERVQQAVLETVPWKSDSGMTVTVRYELQAESPPAPGAANDANK